MGKLGTTPIRLAELHQVLDTNGINQSHAKVMNIDDLMRRLSAWRNQAKHIVFTNGCFDLLHLGHVTLLEKAAELGDVLIVALNTDASVSRLKGQGSPINIERHRSLVLAALASVDAVVFFDEDTPIEIIRKIRPDVLVKGADYREKDVVGWTFVEKYGGKVMLIPLVEGQSTTRLIDKIKSNYIS